MKDGTGGLVPLSQFASGDAREVARLERLRRAWSLIVAPGLSSNTHPISIANGLLLIGCHDTSSLKSMRAAADSTWPQLRERINAMIGTHLKRIEITPSDPPTLETALGRDGKAAAKSGAESSKSVDPLDAVLKHHAAKLAAGG